MKITAKLAYSQLKINRVRTWWSLVGIALSTALTTTVCSFVASGNALIVDMLGSDYGNYKESYMAVLLIPAIILGILIAAMSITVISNVFRVSAQERVSQFGIMKCTGATQKQITQTVIYEGVWLSLIGIPVGILIGLIITNIGIGVVNYFLEDLNDLAHIMMKEISLSVYFVFSWKAVLLSALFSALTVIYSAWRPAHKVAKVSAIDCIRGNAKINTDDRNLHDNKFIKKVFGFEGILADKNLKRNHRNFHATMVSLSVGVILFVSLGGLSKQADAILDYMKIDQGHTVISEYASAYDRKINAKTGREQTTYLHTVDVECSNRIKQQLKQYEDMYIFSMGSDRDTYYINAARYILTEKMQEVYENEIDGKYEMPVEIIVLDSENYERVCEKANVPVGSNILLNHYKYNDFGYERHLEPFHSDIKNMELIKADGSILNIEIDGILTQEQIPIELFYVNTNPVRLIVQNANVRDFTWECSPTDIDEYIEYSNKILAKEFPAKTDSSYMEEGFNTRTYKINDYMKVMNMMIVLAIVLMYSFTALLMLIGLANVISTLSTNVMMRSREFAVLKSVGMTSESLKRMLKYESILCSLKALIYGMPIGISITLLINLPIRLMFPIRYQLPWESLIVCIVIVFFITFATTMYAANRLKNQNLIEAIITVQR